ncbi:hypothetical protein EGW08_013953 [Elysia chlorotica]|uniref:Uncharacterized protein n=1 Tax=Elysia chlorotica TaxID=188477 RepID=A0A433T9N7_ELYCH|nr:hypothetical protein EGW08_013953 [Elysia chlorotica]
MDIWCAYQSTCLDLCKICAHRKNLALGCFKTVKRPSPACTPSARSPETVTRTETPDQPDQASQDFDETHNFPQETDTEITNTDFNNTDCSASTSVIANNSTTSHPSESSFNTINTPIIPITESGLSGRASSPLSVQLWVISGQALRPGPPSAVLPVPSSCHSTTVLCAWWLGGQRARHTGQLGPALVLETTRLVMDGRSESSHLKRRSSAARASWSLLLLHPGLEAHAPKQRHCHS